LSGELPRPLQIQRKQPLQNLFIGQIMRPGVGIQDGVIEGGVEVVEHFGIFKGDDRAAATRTALSLNLGQSRSHA
jgi:hypothetical protein